MENKELKNYEIVIILKGSLTGEEYQEAFNKVKNYMKDLVGFEKIEEIGIKRLAYEVKENTKGYFIDIYCKTKVENVKELEKLYRLDENVIKFITLRKDN